MSNLYTTNTGGRGIPRRIYLSPPHMSGEELKLLTEAFESNWIAPLGPFVDSFERSISEFTGIPHVAALSSGTAGLHLALLLAGVGRGDQVLVSDMTFIASASPIVQLGAEPIFIDSEMESWNLDPALIGEEVERLVRAGRPPKAVVVVHLNGQCADMDPILEICQRHSVTVIEDAAESIGARYKGRSSGSLGDSAVFSFNGNKIITTSGGGALASSNKGTIDKARYLSTQARQPEVHYEHVELGFNYRLSNLLAAVGVGQMQILPQRIDQRRTVFDRYNDLLGDVDGIRFQPEPEWSFSNRWLTCILVDKAKFGASWMDIYKALAAQNIESRPLWKPMHMQPVFKGCRIVGGKVSAEIFDQGLMLPSGSGLTQSEQERIAGIIKSVRK